MNVGKNIGSIVIVYVLVCVATLCYAGGEETLRVLSYNIHMWEPSVKALTEVIKAADADIVGLNEAWNEKRNDEIAKALGYRIICGGQGMPGASPAKAHWINDYYMPQVLLTRHEVEHFRFFNAMAAKDDPSKPDFDPNVPIYRGGTLAVLKTEKGNHIVVLVLHLHPWGGPDNGRMTGMRLDEIKGILSKVKPYSDLPVLIIGDHNTGSHLDGVEGFKVTRYMEEQGYEDLYRTVHPDPKASPGLTCSGSRIDYIFYNRHVKPIDCKVVKKSVFGSRGFDQSDHLAVFGVVKIDSAKGPTPGSALSTQMHLIDPQTPAGLRELFAYDGETMHFVGAHRGGARRNYPENCIATFENTLRRTFAIMEIDPRYAKDGTIVVHHDATLERTTTGKGRVAEMTVRELKRLSLKDAEGAVTGFQIPTLDEVIEWARGKTVLVLDQKDVPVEARIRKIEEHRAEAYVIPIVYSFEDVVKCYETNKNIMMEVMIPDVAKFREFEKTGIPWSNIVAFVGHSRPQDEKLLRMIHSKGACCIAGTSRNLDRDLMGRAGEAEAVKQRYSDLLQRGVDIIETDLPVEVGELLYGRAAVSASRSKFLRRLRFPP